MAIVALVKGFTIGMGMIIPIGVQNSYVLNQGIKQNFHFTAASICILCDLLLMAFGVLGGGALIASNEILGNIITWGGILFLLVYGGIFAKEAIMARANAQTVAQQASSRIAVILTTLAVTLLNPHVYLDTVMIIGSISSQFELTNDKLAFLAGTVSASFIWFYALSAGAAKLSPWLNKVSVQRGINVVIAIIMWTIAISLLLQQH